MYFPNYIYHDNYIFAMKLHLTLLTAVFIIIFSAPGASAQRGRLFTPDNELSSSLINHIMQDSEGYVWVSTEYGLNRTDGTGFTIYHNDPDDPGSLKSNYVRVVYEDRHHTLRIGCINGLMEFDRANDSFVEIPMYNREKRVYPHVAAMIELSNGELWIATLGNGIFRLDRDGRRAMRLDEVTRMVGNDYISCMHEDSSHILWIGTENSGLCRYFPASGTVRVYHADELPGSKISAIVEDVQGNIYVGILDHGGVVAYNRAADTFAPACDRAAGFPVKDVAIDSDGSGILMAVDGGGLKVIRNNTVADYPLDTPNIDIVNSKAHHILLDRDGNLWLGIFQRGVYLSPCNRFKFSYMGLHQTVNPIGNGCVMMVKVDSRSDVWVSCDNDGLYRVYSVTGQCMAHIPMTATVLSMVEDSRGRLWAGTYGGGLALIDPLTSRVSYIPSLAGTRIYGLAIDGDGNLLAATLGDGVFSYDPATGATRQFRATPNAGVTEPGIVTRDWVNDIMIDRRGNVWLATFSGVCRLDPASGTITPVAPLTGSIAYTLAETHDGIICAGTVAGLMRYNPQTGKNAVISVADGMPNDVICGIVEDAARNLWVSTYHGIARYTPSTGAVTTYDAGDGLQGNEFTHGAYCTTPNGTIYFGGTHGVTSFHPYDIEENVRAYTPHIVRLDIFGTPVNASTLSGGQHVTTGPVSETEAFTLAPGDNTFTLHFSTLTFDNPDKITYLYRIPEQSKRWMQTQPGDNRVTFNNVPPGTYTLQFKVAGDNRPEAVHSVTVTILPPWHQTWWAWLVYSLLTLLLLLATIHYWRMRNRERLEKLDLKRAEEVNEAKLQFVFNISHEIRTPMTLIIDPLEKLIATCRDNALRPVYMMIYRNSQRILSLVNQLMDVRRLDKGQMNMHFRETDMVGFVRDVMQPFELFAQENDITLSFLPSEEQLPAWVDLNNFDKVLMNLLSNAFKYTPAGGTITVSLTTGNDPAARPPLDDYVQIVVSDSGIGIPAEEIDRIFERFYRVENTVTQSSFGTGIGLHLVKSLVTLHHGTITVHNRHDGPGCEFVVRIPRGSDHLTAAELATPDSKQPIINNVERSLTASAVNERGDETAPAAHQRPRGRIMVVEDNPEIRAYISRELGDTYTIVAFSNGREALDAVLTETPIPDLIISDIMMPGMDGITLTRKIKKGINTNHIPVILLSARSSAEEMKEGLESGADNYMVKPFNTEVLKMTIANLLANRHLLKVKYSGSQEQEDKVEKIEMKSQDEILMRKIMAVVNARISSPDLSVESLAAEVGISRVHLNRRLKEITNQSARDFIKNIRMRQAARLLREKKLSITEVAYATGFANPSHFSVAFKEIFGITPRAYAASDDRPPQD